MLIAQIDTDQWFVRSRKGCPSDPNRTERARNKILRDPLAATCDGGTPWPVFFFKQRTDVESLQDKQKTASLKRKNPSHIDKEPAKKREGNRTTKRSLDEKYGRGWQASQTHAAATQNPVGSVVGNLNVYRGLEGNCQLKREAVSAMANYWMSSIHY